MLTNKMKTGLVLILFSFFGLAATSLRAQAVPANDADPLPSWNQSAARQAVIDFVERVSTAGSKDFVPESERIAVFDNDGTLWSEAPLPFQAAFAFDELKRRAPHEPELAADPMVVAALNGDLGKLLAGKHHDGLLHVLGLTHAGMTTDEFNERVKNWLKSARHPRFDRHYNDLTYLPMQELLEYLRDHGFEIFIVSGGGADFMRVWAESVYGIPPQNIVASTGRVQYEMRDGVPVLVKSLDHLFVDDKEGKPVGIHHFIGRRPIACFGNSDGDQAMLEYTTIGNPHPSFGLIVHHTDDQREYAYDANPKGSGKLVSALEVAPQRGWTVVDMKNDWKQIWSDLDKSKTMENAIIGKWIADEIDGRGVIDNSNCEIEFKADGSVGGDSGVNRYGGKVTMDGNSIKFGPLMMTRRAGPPALMEQESRLMKTLENVASFNLEDSVLNLLDSNGKIIARFSEDK